MRFETGKLPPEILQRLLDKIPSKDPRVLLGPGIGRDAAVIDMGDTVLVLKTDPVTLTGERMGWYTVNVNANDVAVTGAEPRWFLCTVLLPRTGSDENLVEGLFDEIIDACLALGVAWCGGHTEVTSGLDRPILVGFMAGEAAKDGWLSPDRIRPGDEVLLTKGVAVEGTAIIAREHQARLKAGMDPLLLDRAKKFLLDPGISVVPEARTIRRLCRPHAMHDPTEGGLATGLWEMARAANLGLRIDASAVPFFPETEAVCRILGLDPWGLIASGALLVALEPSDVPQVRSALAKEKIPCASIGRFLEPEEGMVVETRGTTMPLRPFARDELARISGQS
jgi:hydrogenase expression/formation protein HypE